MNVTLNETTNTSGVFNNAAAPFAAFTVTSVIGGDRIRVSYTDASPPSNVQTATINVTSTSGTLTAPATVLLPNNLVVSVTDADANRNPAGLDTVTVQIVQASCPACTAATVNLTETGNATGVFDNSAAAFNYQATLGLGEGAQMTVTYNDTDPVSNIRTATVLIFSSNGQLIVGSNVGISATLLVTVQDPEVNNNPNSVQTIVGQVIASCALPGCGAPQSIGTLTETGNNTGIFTLDWDYKTLPGITPALGQTFTLQYNDANPIANQPQATVTVVQGSNATLTVTPNVTPLNGSFAIFLSDADLKGAGTVNVTAQNISTNTPATPATISLVEEPANSGQFNRSITTNSNGLNGQLGNTIRVRYTDNTPASGAVLNLTGDVLIANLVFGSDARLTVTNTIPGRAINVTLTDGDLGTAASASITVQNTTISDTVEILVLANTGTAGSFAGSIGTAFGTGPDNVADGIVAVKGGDVVRFSYTDENNSSGGSRIVVAESQVSDRRSTALFCNQGTSTSNPTWHAEYFGNKDLAGSALVVADEQNLSINWAETAPFRQIPADGWSARWTTTVGIPAVGRYRFRIGADDGVRFYINENLYVDNWVASPFGTQTVDVGLAPGDNRFKVEYFEDSGSAGLLVDCIFLESPVAVINADGSQGIAFAGTTDFSAAIAHITTGRINVRANPSVNAAWLDYVWIYERYPILGITQSGQWILIDLKDGRSGWVSSRYVRRYEETPVQIYPDFAGSEAATPNIEVAGYATAELKLRTAPRTGDVIALVDPNVGFRVLSRNSNGSWYKIQWGDNTGWVFAPWVVLTNGTVQDLLRE